jgi:D-alanine--poly(phosphoribitol) ligase subunit 2
MENREKILGCVISAIDEINQELPEGVQLEKNLTTVLYGDESVLDSLGLVNLIVITEETVENRFDIAITIANEKAMSLKNSPFRTIDSLTSYIETLLVEKLNV